MSHKKPDRFKTRKPIRLFKHNKNNCMVYIFAGPSDDVLFIINGMADTPFQESVVFIPFDTTHPDEIDLKQQCKVEKDPSVCYVKENYLYKTNTTIYPRTELIEIKRWFMDYQYYRRHIHLKQRKTKELNKMLLQSNCNNDIIIA